MFATDAIFNGVSSCKRSNRLFFNYLWYARWFYRNTYIRVCAFFIYQMTILFCNNARQDVFRNEMLLMFFDKRWYVVVEIISLMAR